MRRLIEATFVTLDGVVESPEKWSLPIMNDEFQSHLTDQLAAYDAFLFGRVTYEQFAATWPQIKGNPYIDAINRFTKFVASRTLRDTTWNATLLEGDVPEAVRRLKAAPGKDIIKYGTGAFDSTLIPHRLIDEFHVSVFPVTVGGGMRLFERVPRDSASQIDRHANIQQRGCVSQVCVALDDPRSLCRG